MATSTQTVQTRGIFHGLPTFPPDVQGLTAIVAGATGISGQHMLHVLSTAPERWSKVYALSRKAPTQALGQNVEHVAVDFLKSSEDIATILRSEHVQADYVFYFAYIQPAPNPGDALWSNSKDMDEINGRLLQNTLGALKLASIEPRRILLQTGLKHYGSHLGPMLTPQMEDDPRITLAPNFYYTQEDMLFEHCRGTRTQWNVTRPGWILGAVEGAAMNIVYPLSVYAAVQKHLGEPLRFPGDYAAWDKEQIQSTAMLNCFFSEWAVLTPEAGDQAFNVGDNCLFTWGRFWPVLASWYGIPWLPPDADAKYTEIEMSAPPRGYGPKGKLRSSWSLVEWAKQRTVQNAWSELSKQSNITKSPFDNIDQNFTPTELALITPWAFSMSMDKSRKMGWHGCVDTMESIREVFDELARLNMTVPIPNPPTLKMSQERV